MNNPMSSVTARILRVIDGDTFEALIDVGFGIVLKRHVRILGINCPELHGLTKAAGEAARAAAEAWFKDRPSVTLLTNQGKDTDAFGRVLAEVRDATGASLGELLLATGNAVPFKG